MVYVGNVKPHVQKVADLMQERFKYRTIYGHPGNGVSGDHPKGLALDFMTYTDMAKGQATADFLVTNYDAFGLTYIIWNRQSYSKPRGTWKKYTRSNPHTDHVHASFKATPGTGVVIGDNDEKGDDEDEAGALTAFKTLFEDLTNPENYMRIALLIAGMILILIAAFRIAFVQRAAKAAAKMGR